MQTIRVSDVKIGEWVKYNDISVICQRHESARIIVSKEEDSPSVFSIPYYSSKYHDQINKVQLAD